MAKTYLHPEFRALQRAREQGQPLAEPWEAFRSKALAHADHPPSIVADIVTQVRMLQGNRTPAELRILDHGCGGGFVLLYLLALGYTGIYGIDVELNEANPVWNEFCRDVVGLENTRFFAYDGRKMPFADNFFDFIFSTQVVEHVEERFWDCYFAEEARVLKPGGRVFHEIPHRLGPYESHTRTWFVHYLPRPIHRRIYTLTGRGTADIHYLRLPSTIRRALQRHIGPTQDYALRAFMENAAPEEFDGPSGLRRMLHNICRAPVVGHLAQALIRPMLMLRIAATKTRA